MIRKGFKAQYSRFKDREKPQTRWKPRKIISQQDQPSRTRDLESQHYCCCSSRSKGELYHHRSLHNHRWRRETIPTSLKPPKAQPHALTNLDENKTEAELRDRSNPLEGHCERHWDEPSKHIWEEEAPLDLPEQAEDAGRANLEQRSARA